MLKLALEVLQEQVSDHLRRIPALDVGAVPPVVLSPISDDVGALQIGAEKVGLTLVNIDEERVSGAAQSIVRTEGGKIRYQNAEIYLVLYLLFSANFGQYPTALRYISQVIGFFQSKKVFNTENTPGLDSSIGQMLVELNTLNFEQQNQLWGYLGANYLPSVLYKVRVLRVQAGLAEREAEPLTGIGLKGSGK